MVTNPNFRGTRGTGDFVTDARPKNWRETIAMLNPRGDTIMTALTTKMRSEKTDDPEFHWWEKVRSRQGGAFTVGEIYIDTLMASAYTSGGVAGTFVHVKTTAAIAGLFRPGHTAIIRNSTYMIDTFGLVTDVLENGASSRVTIKLLEADDNGSGYSVDLSDANAILVAGNANEEGGELPQSLTQDPTKFTNYTQIFKTTYDITRTAMQTHLRTNPNERMRLREEALFDHGVEMEKAFLWGVPTEGVGPTRGLPLRTTGGLKYFIQTYAPSNISDFRYDANFDGQTWTAGGIAWFEYYAQIFQKYGAGNKLMLVGPGTLAAISQLARANGHMNLEAGQNKFGLNVRKWISPFGEFDLILHPLMSLESTESNSMFIVDLPGLYYRYIQDTKFLTDDWKEGGPTHRDGLTEGFLTECGLELHHAENFAYLSGFGQDNP